MWRDLLGSDQEGSRHESVLDISPHSCDYYLVLTGPAGQAPVLPWVIDSVFLFGRERLIAELTSRHVKIGVATSVRKAAWEAAQAFPPQPGPPLQLTPRQIELLKLFSAGELSAISGRRHHGNAQWSAAQT